MICQWFDLSDQVIFSRDLTFFQTTHHVSISPQSQLPCNRCKWYFNHYNPCNQASFIYMSFSEPWWLTVTMKRATTALRFGELLVKEVSIPAQTRVCRKMECIGPLVCIYAAHSLMMHRLQALRHVYMPHGSVKCFLSDSLTHEKSNCWCVYIYIYIYVHICIHIYIRVFTSSFLWI